MTRSLARTESGFPGTGATYLWPVLYGLLAVGYCLPFLMHPTNWGIRDWDLFTSVAAVPVGSIVHYSQFPFWNMYLGGGNILFHHPEVAVLSPFFLLYLLFGAVVGLKLQVVVCYVLGFLGSHRLGERLGLSPLAAALLATVYFGSVHFALHFAEGHMPFTHFAFLPWFFTYVLGAPERPRRVVAAAVVLALMILGNGAAVPFLYTMTLAVVLLVPMTMAGNNWSVLRRFVEATVLGLLLAAVKFVPMVLYLRRIGWEGNVAESVPVSALTSIFFGFDHSLFARNFESQQWSWHEYGAYLSPIVVMLAGVALLRRLRSVWPWLVVLLFFLLLGMGNFGSLSPWAVLTSLPGFSSLRCSGRAWQFVLLAAAVLGGTGFDVLRARYAASHPARRRIATAVLIVVVAGTNLWLAWPIMKSAHPYPPESVHRSETFRHVVDDELHAYRNFLANRGSLVTPWLSAYPPSRGLVAEDNTVLQEYLLSGSATITNREYTPNTITYDIAGERPGMMVVGMGYDPGWRASDNRPITETKSLMSFPFAAGSQTVVLTYRPPWFFPSLALSLLTVLGLLVVYKRGLYWYAEDPAMHRNTN